MATGIKPRPADPGQSRAADTEHGAGSPTTSPVTSREVWRALEHASFAIVSYVTPRGEPRSSGVVYAAIGHRLYLVVAPNSWKARHITLNPHVSVAVPVRRGGLLTLLMPIPPATISFAGEAVVHPAGSLAGSELERALSSLLPPERHDEACVIEIIPEGEFVTYGIGVTLMQMRNPTLAQGRAPVGSV